MAGVGGVSYKRKQTTGATLIKKRENLFVSVSREPTQPIDTSHGCDYVTKGEPRRREFIGFLSRFIDLEVFRLQHNAP